MWLFVFHSAEGYCGSDGASGICFLSWCDDLEWSWTFYVSVYYTIYVYGTLQVMRRQIPVLVGSQVKIDEEGKENGNEQMREEGS